MDKHDLRCTVSLNLSVIEHYPEIYEAYAPLRALLQPLRPALDLALTYTDGEPLALMPFIVDFE